MIQLLSQLLRLNSTAAYQTRPEVEAVLCVCAGNWKPKLLSRSRARLLLLLWLARGVVGSHGVHGLVLRLVRVLGLPVTGGECVVPGAIVAGGPGLGRGGAFRRDLGVLLFLLSVYRWLPNTTVSLREAMPGAVLGAVAGLEVASVVGAVEIAQVAKGKRPKAGASSVEMLKGGDYWRVWLNKGGTNYLINLPPAK